MTDANELEELSQLLPFYLNGSLPQSECERIDAGLAASAELRAELEEHRRLLELVKSGGSEWANTALHAAPAVEVLSPVSAKASPLGSMMAFLSPRNWSPTVSLALALALCAQAAALIWQNRTIDRLRDENFHLASGKDVAPAKGQIIIEISDGAAWSAVSALLGSEGLAIVASGDFGTLTLHSEKTGSELQQQIDRLRASPLITSADPVA